MVEHCLLEIENFCCIQHARINLAKAGLTLILGDNQDTNAAINNGAGKTTIPKALTWCLYEDTIDGDKHDEVIRWEQKQAVVSHTIRINKDAWKITRSRAKGKPHLELAVARDFKKGSEFEIIHGDRKQLQSMINELVGKDFRSFCNTTLYGEGDIARFYSATDSVKKDSVHRLLKSDVFKLAMLHIKKVYYDGLKKKVGELENELNILIGRISEYDMNLVRDLYNRWEEEREQKIATFTEECQTHLSDIERVKKEGREEQDGYKEEIKDVMRKVRALSKKKKQYSDSKSNIELLESELGEADRREMELDVQIETKKESLSLLQGNECPTCTSSLSEGKASLHVNELEKALKKLSGERDEVVSRMNELEDKLKDRKREASTLDKLLSTIGELEHKKIFLEQAIGASKSKVDSYVSGRKLLASESLKTAKQYEVGENPHKHALLETEERVGKLKVEIANKEGELEKTRDDFAHYGFWIKGFGPGGLPSLLLDSKMDYLSERANHYLLTLSDGDISVEYKTQRELKSGGQKDEIIADVVIEGVPGVKPSKAQKRKLDIASDLGLMDMAVSRTGHSNLLMMDEVLDGMDSEGVRRVMDLIHELRTSYQSIFVITHEAGLLEMFERAICARKKNGATNVVVMKG